MQLLYAVFSVIIFILIIGIVEYDKIDSIQFIPTKNIIYKNPSLINLDSSYNFPKKLDDYRLCNQKALKESQIPTLNMQDCFENRFYQCDPYNGSYCQCTNNYIPLPKSGNCQCKNRTFEMCPKPYKLSEDKYYKTLWKCLYNKNLIHSNNKKYNNNYNEKYNEERKPRVNVWKYNGIDNNFLVQCK